MTTIDTRRPRVNRLLLVLLAAGLALAQGADPGAPPETAPTPAAPADDAPADKPADPPAEKPADEGGAPVDESGQPLVSNVFFDTDLRQALSDTATQAGVTIIPDESVRGFVTLELTDVPLERALDLMLMGGGYVWEEIDENVYLVTSPEPTSPSFRTIARTQVVPLQHITTAELAAVLPDAWEPYVRLDEVGNRAVIVAPSKFLASIAAWIAEVDHPTDAAAGGGAVAIEVVDLQYLSGEQLQALLPAMLRRFVTVPAEGDRVVVAAPPQRMEDLLAQLKALDRGTDQVQVVELQNATATELAALLPESLKPHVTAEAAGQRVVVSGPPRRLPSLVAQVLALDAQLSVRGRSTRLVHLDYITGADLTAMLPEAFAPMVRTQPEGYRVLVTAPPQVIDAIAAQIELLDHPPVQVLIEALVVETTESNLRDFAIQLQGDHLGLDTVNGLMTYVGQAAQLLHQILWLVTNDKATIKASPRVVAQEGRQAQVQVAVNQYYRLITLERNIEYVELEPIEAAIGLTITPRVAIDDGMVTCLIQPQVDDVTGTGADNLPIITRRTATTTVRVADGQVIAIGGLLQAVDQQIERKIPILGDLPLIGPLFRSTSSTHLDREVVIFVVPHILGDDGQYQGKLLFEQMAQAAPAAQPVASEGPAPQVAPEPQAAAPEAAPAPRPAPAPRRNRQRAPNLLY